MLALTSKCNRGRIFSWGEMCYINHDLNNSFFLIWSFFFLFIEQSLKSVLYTGMGDLLETPGIILERKSYLLPGLIDSKCPSSPPASSLTFSIRVTTSKLTV